MSYLSKSMEREREKEQFFEQGRIFYGDKFFGMEDYNQLEDDEKRVVDKKVTSDWDKISGAPTKRSHFRVDNYLKQFQR